MAAPDDKNAALWQSEEVVQHWVAAMGEREKKHGAQRQMMALLLPFERDDEFLAADLGAGTGLTAKAILDTYPKAHVILADFSAQMMEEGSRSLQPYEGRYEYTTFDMQHEDWPAALSQEFDAVLTSLTVHHLSDDRKQALFTGIFEHLTPGGWYLNYDPVNADDPVVAEAWQRVNDRLDPSAAAKRHNRTPLEQERHENHIRYMIPLGPQLEFLRHAGFEGIDVYWKSLDNVIYGGRRPAGSGPR